MVRKYIKRDFTDHAETVEYLSDEDEYIKFEVFSFDPKHTKTFVAEKGTLTGENAYKTSFKEWICFRSKDQINPMEFTLSYTVKESGVYRIDLLYEQNSKMYTDTDYNTSKDLTGWYDIYDANRKEHTATTTSKKKTKIVYPAGKLDEATKKATEQALIKKGKLTKQQLKDNKYLDNLIEQINNNQIDTPNTATLLKFEGEDNILKRKTIFTDTLNVGNYKIEFGVPHNCYVYGVIVRKVLHFYGTNNDEEGSQLQFTEAKLTQSEMLKPAELQVTVGYDDAFECESVPSGLYLDYMDECNLYVKNNEGDIVRVFGGYVSTPLPTNDRTTIDIHCADRLKDGENKYILDYLMLQGGDTNIKDLEYKDPKSFNTYPQALKYLCETYEVTLNHNINNSQTVEGQKYIEGWHKKFGKKKDIKKIKTTNGQVTVNNSSITLRNSPSGEKKQVWTLWTAKKTPVDITGNVTTEDYFNLHITYGLGDAKTTDKKKETTTVDVADGTAGSQKFGKCGQSADKKYVMAIGQRSVGRGSSTYPYNTIYRTIFVNKCPHCGKPLVWDSGRADTDCVHCGRYQHSKREWGNISETEITCTNCCADFCAVTGWDKDGKYSKQLKKVGKSVKSSKAEQNKLHKGNMVALANWSDAIKPEQIFKAIRNSCKGWKHSTGTGSTASYLEKHHVGDCFAWSDWISKQLKKYKVNHKIVKYPASVSEHRSVMYQNSNGKYVDFPYREYNFPKGTWNTSGSKSASTYYKYTAGGRINQAVTSGSTTKTQTTEITITNGYDKDAPFQAYLDIVYSIKKSLSAKKYHCYVNFTQIAKSNRTMSGLEPVWVNNSSKTLTLKNFVKQLLSWHDSENATHIYLHAMHFVAPIKEKVNDGDTKNKSTWYTYDKTTQDNSSCKMKLYGISFDNLKGTQPSDLASCGKSVNEVMKTIVDEADYLVRMEYGLHRHQDKINFYIDPSNEPVFHATEGDSNNILNWGNISYDPANSLFNMSRCVFKNNTNNNYSYVDTKDAESILNYQEQCTLQTENEGIGEKEAYWRAKHSDKYNPVETYTFTITVKGLPDVRLKELVKVTANLQKLNTIKEVNSLTLNYKKDTKPVLQTEMGLGELAPDIQVLKNIKKLRDDAKKETTHFYGTASPIDNDDIYEWTD